MPIPTHVIFFCLGTTEKPTHQCSREAVASIAYALDAPLDQFVFAGGAKALDGEPPPEAVPYQPLLARIRQKIGQEPLRVQVKCRTCSTVSILTDALIEEPEVEVGSAIGNVFLMAPTPGDEALLDAAKGVSGAEAVKNSMANAIFVTANVALLTTLVTTLGLSKQEEIGSKVTGGWPGGFFLAAVVLGAVSLILALGGIIVRVRPVRSANLEEVRSVLRNEVSERAAFSGSSLFFLGGGIACVAFAFFLIGLNTLRKDDAEPKGSLTVAVNPATLNAAIETSWTGAAKGTELHLDVEGAASVNATDDPSDGVAEIKTSAQLIRDASTVESLSVTSKLVKDEIDVSGAMKQLCYELPTVGGVRKVDCP